MLDQIQRYGSIRPQGVGRSASQVRMEALANLGKNISNAGFSLLAKKRQEQGKLEGLKSGQEAVETGEIKEQKSLFPSTYEESFNNAQQAAYLAGVDRQAVERLSELENEFSHDPEAFQKSAQGMLEGYVKNAPESYKYALNESIGKYVSRGTMRINNNVVMRGKEEAKSELLGAIDTYSREASRAARNGDIDGAEDYLNKAALSAKAVVDAGFITQEQADEQYRLAKNEVAAQDLLLAVDELPLSEAEKRLEKEESFIPEGFSGDERDRMLARAKMRLKQRQVEASKAMSDDGADFRNRDALLRTAIRIGEGDPEQLFEELNFLYARGVYKPATYASLYGQINDGLSGVQDVWERLGGDNSKIVEKKFVNKVYQQHFIDQNEEVKARFVEQLNVVPDQMKKEITNSLYSGDIQQAAEAARLVDRLDGMQGLTDVFSGKEKAYAAQISDLMEIYPPEQAIDKARKATNPDDRARIENVQESLKKDYKDKHWKSMTEDAVGPWFGSIDSAVEPQLRQDFKTAFSQYRIEGMDEKQAKKASARDLRRSYSEWGGRLMKFSPDQYYQVGGSSDWVATDLIKELANNIAGAPEIQDFYFITDEQTAIGASSGKPGYLVRYKTKDGWDILKGRYYPDIEAAKRGDIEENKELINKLRGKSKRDEFNDPFMLSP